MEKLAMLLVACIFFVTTLIYTMVVILNPVSDDNTDSGDTQQTQTTDESIDTDGDGLLDWEEDLYGSSKYRADTDGDGVNDAQEVAQGSDPSTYYSQNILGDVTVIQEETDEYRFNQTGNPGSVEDIVNAVAGEIKNQSQQSSDTRTQGSEFSPLKQCINDLGVIVKNSLVTTPEDSAVIGQYLLGEVAHTAPVEALRDAQLQAADRLTRLSLLDCPQLHSSHQALQETYLQTGEIVNKILNSPQASQEQYQLWQEYSISITQWLEEIHTVRALAETNQISYKPSEPGYIFTQSSVQ